MPSSIEPANVSLGACNATATPDEKSIRGRCSDSDVRQEAIMERNQRSFSTLGEQDWLRWRIRFTCRSFSCYSVWVAKQSDRGRHNMSHIPGRWPVCRCLLTGNHLCRLGTLLFAAAKNSKTKAHK